MDWTNPSGQKYFKIVSEVEKAWTNWANASGQKYSKILSEVKF